jgi:hypothetical protein
MNVGTLFAFALLTGAVGVGGTALAQKTGGLNLAGMQVAADERAHEGRNDDREAGNRGDRLSMVQIAGRVSEQGYTDISEVEREDGGYEVKARDTNGRRVELYVDGRTGQILGSEFE